MLCAELRCLCLLCARSMDTGVRTELKTEKSKGLQENDRILGKVEKRNREWEAYIIIYKSMLMAIRGKKKYS